MDETGSRRGAANTMSLVLAAAAFVTVGGLIWWLSVTAEPTAVAINPADTASDEPVSDVPIVTLESLRAEMAEYQALELEMRNLSVNSQLGDQAFWVGPQDNPFLVKMEDSAALGSDTAGVAQGDTVSVRGVVQAMSDSVLNAWEETGIIAGAGERAVASFAEFFLEANQVRKGTRSGGGGGGQPQRGADTTRQGSPSNGAGEGS